MIIRGDSQTIVRRLKSWQMKNPNLNPFIEKRSRGKYVAHSPSSAATSASPKPSIHTDDVAIVDPVPELDEPQRPEFVSALRDVLGLSEEDLAVLRSTEPSSASPFASSTLCAVSWVLAWYGCVVH